MEQVAVSKIVAEFLRQCNLTHLIRWLISWSCRHVAILMHLSPLLPFSRMLARTSLTTRTLGPPRQDSSMVTPSLRVNRLLRRRSELAWQRTNLSHRIVLGGKAVLYHRKDSA